MFPEITHLTPGSKMHFSEFSLNGSQFRFVNHVENGSFHNRDVYCLTKLSGEWPKKPQMLALAEGRVPRPSKRQLPALDGEIAINGDTAKITVYRQVRTEPRMTVRPKTNAKATSTVQTNKRRAFTPLFCQGGASVSISGEAVADSI